MPTTAHTAAGRKDIMMREGDHRIKNSLQIVSSLLSQQAGRPENAAAHEALLAASTRIQAIARIHDALQDRGGTDDVDLDDLLVAMTASLQSMAGETCKLTVVTKSARILIPVALVQSVVLAVNELVVNALRHACPDGRAGSIRVSASATDGEFSVSVSDNGVGLPDNFAQGRGYGMKLVRMMVQQVSGELRVESRDGVTFTIVVPIPRVAGSSQPPFLSRQPDHQNLPITRIPA